VDSVRRRLGHDKVSQRRACHALGQPRSTQRYQPKRPEMDRALIGAMRRITDARPRFGCERVHSENADVYRATAAMAASVTAPPTAITCGRMTL